MTTQKDNPKETRPIDKVVESSYAGLIKRLKLVSNKQIKLWKALIIIAFVAGFVAALTYVVSYDREEGIDYAGTGTEAAEGDIVNKAYVTYKDGDGNSYSGESNENTVTFIISGNRLEVHISLECRNNHDVPVVVTILNSGTQSVALTLSGNTDVNGVFVDDVGSLSGVYDVRVKVDYYLTKKLTGIQIPSQTQVEFNYLLAGDLQIDNIVNTGDYVIMSQAWYTSSPEADINKDGVVNTGDFVCLSSNWYVEGT